MNMRLLLLREELKLLYAKYGKWIEMGMKAVLAFASLYLLRQALGFSGLASNLVVCLAVSLFCGVLPWGGVTVVCGFMWLLQLSALSLELLVAAAAFFLVIFLAYYIFLPGNSVILLLIPVLFYLKIPYAVPICVGLVCSVTSVVPVGFGVILAYLLRFVETNALLLKDSSDLGTLQRFARLVGFLKDSKELWLTVAVFGAVTLAVYALRRSSGDWSWRKAITAGGILMVAGMITGIYVLDLTGISVVWVLLGTVLAVVIAVLLEFLFFAVDYSRTEYAQFEDDEYYYYVKAVPKINVTQPEVTVKRITRQSRKRDEGGAGRTASGQDAQKLRRGVPEARIFEEDR